MISVQMVIILVVLVASGVGAWYFSAHNIVSVVEDVPKEPKKSDEEAESVEEPSNVERTEESHEAENFKSVSQEIVLEEMLKSGTIEECMKQPEVWMDKCMPEVADFNNYFQM